MEKKLDGVRERGECIFSCMSVTRLSTFDDSCPSDISRAAAPSSGHSGDARTHTQTHKRKGPTDRKQRG